MFCVRMKITPEYLHHFQTEECTCIFIISYRNGVFTL